MIAHACMKHSRLISKNLNKSYKNSNFRPLISIMQPAFVIEIILKFGFLIF